MVFWPNYEMTCHAASYSPPHLSDMFLTILLRLAARQGRLAHPGIYQFSGVLKKELQNTRDKIEQFENGRLGKTQSAKARTLLVSRLRLKEMFLNRQISLKKYLRTHGQLNLKQKYRPTRRQERGGVGPGDAAAAEEGRVDNAVRRALVSVGEEDEEAAEGGQGYGGGRRGARGRPRGTFANGGGRARGIRGRGAAPAYRICEGCGCNYRSNYIRRHQRDHCGGLRAAEEEHQEEEPGGQEDEEDVEDVEEELHLDQALAEANDIDQTLLGARRRTGSWRRQDGEEERQEEIAIALQQQIERERHQERRGRYMSYSSSDSAETSTPRQRRRLNPGAQLQRQVVQGLEQRNQRLNPGLRILQPTCNPLESLDLGLSLDPLEQRAPRVPLPAGPLIPLPSQAPPLASDLSSPQLLPASPQAVSSLSLTPRLTPQPSISTFHGVDWSTGTESVINQILANPDGEDLRRVRIVSQSTPVGGSILDTDRGSRGNVQRIRRQGQLPFSSTPSEEIAVAVESLQCSVILEPTSLGLRFVNTCCQCIIHQIKQYVQIKYCHI